MVWVLHKAALEETCNIVLYLGRIDQYLLQYYETDIKDGYSSRECERDIIFFLWKKLSEYKINSFQNVTLGGCDIMEGRFLQRPDENVFGGVT